MGHMERALEWLRPLLLGFETWDYCVVWKLSVNGFSRSIDWMNCCCVGVSDGESCRNSPTRDGKEGFPGLCRDTFNPHPASNKSCLALAQLPFSITLQSGIYGEVIVSGQPRWINLFDTLSLKASHEAIGTRVLIPVLGGLVELFATKQILENQGIIGFVAAQFDVSSKVDNAPSLNCKEVTFTEDREFFLGGCTNSLIDYFQQSDLKPLDLLSMPKLEGSPFGSSPSCLGPGSPSQNSSPKQQHGAFSSLEDAKENKDQYQFKQNMEISSGCDTCVTGKDISIVSHREDIQKASEEEKKESQFRSKNLIVERKRRARIKHGLCNLRSLVPKITKMSQAATLEDAVDHIVEMNTKVKELQEELEELERDGCNNGPKLKPFGSNETAQVAAKLDTSKHALGSSHCKFHKVQVEVNQLTVGEFLIRILCKAKVGAFTTLLETLEYLGLQVTQVNFTSCKGIASSSFMVQVNNGEIQAAELRDVLIKLTCG